MVVRVTRPGKSSASQPPQAHTTASASRRSPPSDDRVALRPRAPAHDARAVRGGLRGRASRIARCARSTPASGSWSRNSRSSPRKLGNSRAPSSTLSRSTGMSCARMVRSRRGLPAVGAAGEPHEPALDQEVRARLRLELAPQRAGAARRRRVVGVVAVAAADQARLAARGRARGRRARTGRRA